MSAFITLEVRINESRGTRYATRNVHNSSNPPGPLAAIALAAALTGCVGYSSYPSGNYSYSYPSGYYAGYPSTYSSSYGYRPFYSPDYGRYNNTYETGGAGGQ